MEKKTELGSYLENITLLLLGVLFVGFPLVFTTLTTDPFALPKQALLVGIAILLVVIAAIRMISEGSIKLRRTPFDIPVVILTIFIVISSFMSQNRFDSLITVVPFVFAVLVYFAIVNLVKGEKPILFLIYSLLAGASVASIISILYFFNIYILPFPETRFQSFSTFGSLLDQAIYFAILLPIAGYFAIPLLKGKVKKIKSRDIVCSIMTIILATGLGFSVYQLIAVQGILILPFDSGIQIAFATISQDSGRVIQSLLFGSGFGTFATDFTRFKQATLNLNASLWPLTFFRSSSFVLELMATTGILGLAAFIALVIRIVKSINDKGKGARYLANNPLLVSMVLILIGAILLPFSFVLQALFFIVLGLFAAIQGLLDPNRYYDVEIHMVAFKKGLVSIVPEGEGRRAKSAKFLPVAVGAVMIVFIALLGYLGIRHTVSDVTFQKSLVAASQNNGGLTYDLQNQAITEFPWRDAYYRIFSQTNLALANSLASQTPQGASPSAQTQQTIYTLIQQSINSGRTATTIAPLTVANWQNLASIYRALIGFGQNAENFAALAMQQAIVLDPNNPQNYLTLGGLFYQLGQWDDAQRQFQIAIQLKPDFANAYYNLGHALEEKGDLEGALAQYQAVKTLVANDKQSTEVINEEIEKLQAKIGGQETTSAEVPEGETDEQPNLNVSSGSAQQLPARNPQISIPAPTVSVTPTEAPSPTPNN